jgi:hypothetical protein
MTVPKEAREAGIAAIANGWHGLKDCPGDMYEREAAALFDAAISALGEAGYAVVPKEPTRLMLSCGVRDYVGGERYARDHEYCDANFTDKMRAAYAAMLSASQEQGK